MVFSPKKVRTYRKMILQKKSTGILSNKKNKKVPKMPKGSFDEKGYKEALLLRVGYYLLTVLFVASTVYLLLFSRYVYVDRLEVVGLRDIPSEDVLAYINEYAREKYLFLFPKGSYFFFLEDDFTGRIMRDFPKVRSVVINKQFPSTIRFEIQEREAFLIWCSQECYVLDEKGSVYEKESDISYVPQSRDIIRLQNKDGQTVQIGDNILSTEVMQFFIDFQKGLKGLLALEVERSIDVHKDIVQEASVVTSEGWTIHINTNLSAQKSLRMLRSFFKVNLTTLEEREKLEYVDIRVENKVFYKLKSEFLENKAVNEDEMEEKNDENEAEDNVKDAGGEKNE